ncbi:AAA family ATPase [Paenibacillus polymyxa]|uniref:AAA family ATPase n=1 Tax=Paenibacillus polymyxa TaxID=1406 RepID=UPI0004072EF8|nr:AAA family ATPase [Paenibacillus polymyxa]
MALTPEERAERIRNRKAKAALNRLNALPGMTGLKEQINQMVQFAKVSKLRERMGLKTESHSNHMVFTGNPGTGKTTAARLIGEAFVHMGLLKTTKNEIPFVEVHQSDITESLVGGSEKKISAKFDAAQGGVLFIDEAYSFLGKSEHNTDSKVMTVIVQKMEDMRDEIMVIAAGYPKEMEDFLNFNPGLRSRFSNKIHFPDYAVADLVAIAEVMCAEREYEISPDYRERLSQRLDQERMLPGFGNARTVRNIVEQSIRRQSLRVSVLARPDRDELVTLLGDDVSLLSVQPVVSEKEQLLESISKAKKRLFEIEVEELLS